MWLRQLFQSTATDQNSIFIYLHASPALAYEECLYPSDSSRYDFTKTPVAPQAGTRKSTIMQLQQFARSYTCVPSMPVALGAFVAN